MRLIVISKLHIYVFFRGDAIPYSTSGLVLTIRVHASDWQQLVGYAEVMVAVNAPPTSGIFSLGLFINTHVSAHSAL